MMENKYPYDNWKSITESDFVTLFIKTWFAFVSTLREMYPAEIPYYQATGDSRYISPYKRDFSQNIAYRLNYTDIKYHLYEVYKHGMKIIADRYPRFIVDDFYSLNLSFKETASEEFSLEGGFSGKFVCTVKCASAETLTATIMCTNKSYRTKVDKDYAPIGVSVDYSAILMAIVQEIEDWQFVLTEASLIERFYEKLFNAISDAFFSEINNAKSSIPEKGNKRFLKVFDIALQLDKHWTTEAVINVLDNAVKYSPQNSHITISIEKQHFYTLVKITDEGIGISQSEYNKIFQRFYRSNHSYVKKTEGSGVGLYLTRMILERQGGLIRVESVPEKGSTFILQFRN